MSRLFEDSQAEQAKLVGSSNCLRVRAKKLSFQDSRLELLALNRAAVASNTVPKVSSTSRLA